MGEIGSDHITRLLNAPDGSAGAEANQLLELVYEQLRAVAQQRMAGERADHTLTATALVHEAYLKLVGDREVQWSGRGQFYMAAVEAMKRILVDHARTRGRVKRGGEALHVPLDNVVALAAWGDPEKILTLEDTIHRLEEVDPQAVRVVDLRVYAGLSIEDTAKALGVSASTVDRDWAFARAWLIRALGPGS